MYFAVTEVTPLENYKLNLKFRNGEEKVFEISVNPDLLVKYNLSSLDVYNAVQKSNLNVGGDVI